MKKHKLSFEFIVHLILLFGIFIYQIFLFALVFK